MNRGIEDFKKENNRAWGHILAIQVKSGNPFSRALPPARELQGVIYGYNTMLLQQDPLRTEHAGECNICLEDMDVTV